MAVFRNQLYRDLTIKRTCCKKKLFESTIWMSRLIFVADLYCIIFSSSWHKCCTVQSFPRTDETNYLYSIQHSSQLKITCRKSIIKVRQTFYEVFLSFAVLQFEKVTIEIDLISDQKAINIYPLSQWKRFQLYKSGQDQKNFPLRVHWLTSSDCYSNECR